MARIGLVEVFRSVQGEGYNSGRPAIFVRTSGCPLACVFADGAVCDTPYQQALIKGTLDEIFAEQIMPLVGSTGLVPPFYEDDQPHRYYPRRHENALMLIITGGEPTMQPQFDAMVHRAHALGFFVAVETNGTRWREGLTVCDWLSVSPKDNIKQGSQAPHHNPHPQVPQMHERVWQWMNAVLPKRGGEYRYVITGPKDAPPPYFPAFRHYVSPAVLSDGTGLEWRKEFPGFVPGALERCLEIVDADPRWRVSLQTHKLMKVR